MMRKVGVYSWVLLLAAVLLNEPIVSAKEERKRVREKKEETSRRDSFPTLEN